jgi:hypothetical protein
VVRVVLGVHPAGRADHLRQRAQGDRVNGEQLALLGIGRAAAGADPDWMRAAHDAIRWLASTWIEFSSDDVWFRLDAAGVSTPEPRALGAVFRQARTAGLITQTGRYRKSIRPECHARPVATWKAA